MYDGEKESLPLLQQTPSRAGYVSLRAVARVSQSLAILFVYNKAVLVLPLGTWGCLFDISLVLFVPVGEYKVLVVHY